MKTLIVFCMIFALSGLHIHASELEEINEIENVEVEEISNDVAEEGSEIDEHDIKFDIPVEVYSITPLPTYVVNPDDYNSSGVSLMAINDGAYSGSYNSTALSLWQGLVDNNVGKQYVAYRASQYEYVIIFGEDFGITETGFNGYGKIYTLNTYGQSYTYSISEDYFNVSTNNCYVYTNVVGDYPALGGGVYDVYEQIQTVLLFALLFFGVVRWIFTNR